MKFITFLVTLGLLFALFSFSSAQVPQMINYQGKLTKATGAPLDTTISIVFTIYADSGGITSKWSETQVMVKIEKGIFNVLLGDVNPIPDSVFNGEVRYLGVKVGGDPEITPRKAIVSVAYAFRSVKTDTAQFAISSAPDDDWDIDTSGLNVYRLTGNAGIGTPSPQEKLDVVGTAQVTGFKMPTGASNGYVLTSDVSGVGTWQATSAGGDLDWTFRVTDTADTTLTTGGAWGIARYGNVLYGNADSTHLNLGVACTTGVGGQNYKYCTVGGGLGNKAQQKGTTVGGGTNNIAAWSYGTVGGGWYNYAANTYATIAGGATNLASGLAATVGGGEYNIAGGNYATVGGGEYDTASGSYATVGGGYANLASGSAATVGGGSSNIASGLLTTVGGGMYDTASGGYATVPGGYLNKASGNYSFAAGRRAKATGFGSFVWADGTDADFASTNNNQFLIRASGGVGIGTNYPAQQLHVAGTVQMNGLKMTTGAINGYVLTSDASGVGTWQAVSGGMGGSGTTNYIPKFTDSNTLGNSVIYEKTGGYVGLGTTDPGYQKFLISAPSYQLALQESDGATDEKNWSIQAESGLFHIYSVTDDWGGWATVLFADRSGAGVERVGIPSRLGVGSGYPNAKLEIVPPEYDDTTDFIMCSSRDWDITAGDRFIVKNNGNTGIGTISPTAKLDVTGSTGYNQVRMRTSYTPTGTGDANGNIGDIAWDSNYFYVKTSAGWKRTALSTW